VLDLSKIEAAEMRLASLPYDLVQTVRESLESTTPDIPPTFNVRSSLIRG
jgi:hypothetical protein